MESVITEAPKLLWYTLTHNNALPINEVVPLFEAAAASQNVAIKNLEFSSQISTTIYTHFV